MELGKQETDKIETKLNIMELGKHGTDKIETKLNLMESGIHRVIEAANRNETKLTHMESGIQETDRTKTCFMEVHKYVGEDTAEKKLIS